MGLFSSAVKSVGSTLSGVTDAVGLTNNQGQRDANETNIKLANQANAWQERMSNTAYQRAMDDMKKAGLNPILAYQQGGASVPTAAVGKVDAVGNHGLARTALENFSGIKTAMAATSNAQTAQANSESTIALQGAQSAQAIATTEKTQAETAKTIDSIKNQKVARRLEEAQIPLATAKEKAANMAVSSQNTLSRGFDKMLHSTAKGHVDPKTLEYKSPIKQYLDSFYKPKGKK